MQAEEVEQMLHDRAIHTRIRPPLAERIKNLGHNRLVTSVVMAGVALVCSLAVRSGSTLGGNAIFDGIGSPQITDFDSNKRPEYQTPALPYSLNGEPVAASLAMSPIGG